MRILVGCLLMVATTSTLAPSSEELRKQYGPPNSERRNGDSVLDSETFTMRPGVSITAQYGSGQRACQIEVAPTLDLGKPIQYQYLFDETVSEVLEEFAPVAMRGKEFGEGTKNSIHV